jgi:hypothetical protein
MGPAHVNCRKRFLFAVTGLEARATHFWTRPDEINEDARFAYSFADRLVEAVPAWI